MTWKPFTRFPPVDVFRKTSFSSHDLVESGYARSALAGTVELYEDHPSSYLVDVSRRHRWIRGDWQIARVAPVACPWSGWQSPT